MTRGIACVFVLIVATSPAAVEAAPANSSVVLKAQPALETIQKLDLQFEGLVGHRLKVNMENWDSAPLTRTPRWLKCSTTATASRIATCFPGRGNS